MGVRTIRIDDGLWAKFTQLAEGIDETPSLRLRYLIERDVEDYEAACGPLTPPPSDGVTR